MSKLLWEPSQERRKNANMPTFIDFVNARYKQTFHSYWELCDWSINKIADFWASVWDFVEIKASKGYETVVDDLSRFPGAKWFPGARLNFAENILKYRDNHVAFVFKGETHETVRMT